MKNNMNFLVALIIATIGICINNYAQEAGTFTDERDGHVYKTVKIDTLVWMAENLAYKTNSGSFTPGNDENNVAIYGRLYIWEVAQNVCPSGWHLPSDAEWTQLTDYLGGKSTAGGKMKETGNAHWYMPNSGATDSLGFSALPGGFGHNDGNSFGSVMIEAYFWSSTENQKFKTDAWYRKLTFNGENINRSTNGKNWAYSVRCIKD